MGRHVVRERSAKNVMGSSPHVAATGLLTGVDRDRRERTRKPGGPVQRPGLRPDWDQNPITGGGGTLDALTGSTATLTIPEPWAYSTLGPFWAIHLNITWTIVADLSERTLPLAITTDADGRYGPTCPLGHGLTSSRCGFSIHGTFGDTFDVGIGVQGADLLDVFDGTDGTWSVDAYLSYEFISPDEEP